MAESAIEWVSTNVNLAPALSDRALVAGYDVDNSPLWLIRARYNNGLLPGKLASKHCNAWVPWRGRERSVYDIEVCCVRPEKVKWVKSRDGIILPNAIVGGISMVGEKLYIGRVLHHCSLLPGKVQPSHQCMYISFAGKEITYKQYEILCTV